MPAKKSLAKKPSAKHAGSSSPKTGNRKTLSAKTSARKSTAGAKRSSRSRTEDGSRIDVNQAYELRDWSKELGVTPARLKQLVAEHGTSAARDPQSGDEQQKAEPLRGPFADQRAPAV